MSFDVQRVDGYDIVLPSAPGTLDVTQAPDAFVACTDEDIKAIRRIVREFSEKRKDLRVCVVLQCDECANEAQQ